MSRTRPLAIEQLEDRSLSATVQLTVELRASVGGIPGDTIAAVTPGETFFVAILAEELDPLLEGLDGVALNITSNPAVLDEIDGPFDPNAVVTGKLCSCIAAARSIMWRGPSTI